MIHNMDLPKPTPHNVYPCQWTRHIWLLGIREFPSFLVVGKDASAIIEAGVSALAPKLMSDLKSLNLAVPLKYLIATHAHADHVNGLMKLKQILPDLSVVGLKTTADILGKKKIAHQFIQDDDMYAKYLSDSGILTKTFEKLSGPPMQFDLKMNHHQFLDLGNLRLYFWHAPGHAPGNTAIHVDRDNAFLISDTAGYANGKDDILPLFFHNYNDYIDSLHTIRHSHPDHIGLGHNLVITGEKESSTFLDKAVESARKIKNQIIRDIDRNIPVEKIESGLADKMVDYGFFRSFSRKTLMALSQLLVRRATEV